MLHLKRNGATKAKTGLVKMGVLPMQLCPGAVIYTLSGGTLQMSRQGFDAAAKITYKRFVSMRWHSLVSEIVTAGTLNFSRKENFHALARNFESYCRRDDDTA
jgi:hypothetical protein